MTDTPATPTPTSWFRSLAAHLKVVSTFITSVSIILGAIAAVTFPIAKPFLEPWLDLPLQVERIQRQLSILQSDIEELRPQSRVAEYDERRSFIDGPCYPGEACSGQYRLWRTETGSECGRPEGTARVVNGHGIQHTLPAEDVMTEFIRVTRVPEIVSFAFIVPENALPGEADYFYALEYPCGARWVAERSFEIPFTIVERGRP